MILKPRSVPFRIEQLSVLRKLSIVALCISPIYPSVAVGPATGFEYLADELSSAIMYEIEDKDLRSISIAIVDDQEIVWAQGFGTANLKTGTAASPETVYRVGSVSKLFTDFGVMQLMERGELDIDAPVQQYLPDFRPKNPFGTSITLRQLMSHRGGLVREPPAGNYFDATGTTLADTVASLNETELVFEPGTRTKYSNAGIAVVGRVLEKVANRPFAPYLKSAVLDPMGMSLSGFEPSPTINDRLAMGEMWSYDGRRFEAPPIQLGMAPAGSMYSSVLELCRFMSVVFRDGATDSGRLLQATTLNTMLTPQFAEPDARTGYGIGFRISDMEGRLVHGHGGAIYGYSTQLQFLKGEKLGVVVISSTDVTNTITRRIAQYALSSILAEREGEETPDYVRTEPVSPLVARAVEGEYVTDDGDSVEFFERNGGLYTKLGLKYMRVRTLDEELYIDDRLGFGPAINVLPGGSLGIAGKTYRRQVDQGEPSDASPDWKGLIGEYGWDHNVLVVFESQNRLNVLLEWTEIDMLEDLGDDRFAFSKTSGMYHNEVVTFRRDKTGKAMQAVVGGIVFPRRTLAGESDETFSIEPVKPIDQLRQVALNASPPDEDGEFRPADLVDLRSLDPTIRYDIRYASTNNFMRSTFYTTPKALMQRPAAEALVRAHQKLRSKGYGLLIHDAYRPWHVTKMFWDATAEEMKHFVADPSEGSRHNRGCAVDLTLFDLETGEPVSMVGQYDEFSERSYPNYMGGTSLQRWHREFLRDAMETEGFTVYEFEWWHFDYQDWQSYRIGNETFEDILN